MRDREGDVELEILRPALIDGEHELPRFAQRFSPERFRHELAEPQQVVVMVTRPLHGQVQHPAVFLAQPRDDRRQLLQRGGLKGSALKGEVHDVLVAVDRVAVHPEPLAVARRVAHQPKRIGERTVKALVDEIPRQRRDHVRKTLGRLVPRPARRNRGNRPRLQQMKLASDKTPLDVLRKTVAALHAEEQIGKPVAARR